MKADAELHWHEWDFDCCPDDQLMACLHYEYAREALKSFPELGENVAQFRALLPKCKTWDDFSNVPPEEYTRLSREGFVAKFWWNQRIYRWVEWPESPFLKIAEIERAGF